MPTRALLRCLPIAAVLLVASGCGGSDPDVAQSRSDARLAQEIDANAKQHEQQRDKPQTATTGQDPTTTVAAGESLPAGSGEIDGTQRGTASNGAAAAGRSSSPSSSHTLFSVADHSSFARLSRALGGRSGVAVSSLGFSQRVQALGTLRSSIAWSTSKVPVAMAVIDAGLADSAQADLRQAITASDNASAERLWSRLGGGEQAARAADAQLRAAGDQRTQIQAKRLRAGYYTPFGQTVWRLTDQTRFAAGMPCLDAGARVLGLMNEITPSERWGLGAAGVDAQFKGGWGPGTNPGANGGYHDRQMGVLTISGKPVAVAIATVPSDGGHTTGAAHLTTIARWIVSHVDVTRVPRTPRCSE